MKKSFEIHNGEKNTSLFGFNRRSYWLTIQLDGSAKEVENELAFWREPLFVEVRP